jgi:TolA-binding protein
VVMVKGTAFHVGFDAEKGRLALQMREGVVEVRGPSSDRRLTLRAGESLELFAKAPAAEHQTDDSSPGKLAMLEQPSPSTGMPAPGAVDSQPMPTPGHLSHRARSKAGESPVDNQHAWANLIARGEFAAVVKDAEDRGLDVALARVSAAELTSLADAARYTRRYDLARQALLRVRDRFPGSNRSSDAAFFLGRLAESGASSSPKTALTWYETYLRESAQGPYAGEALGRQIALFSQSDRPRARAASRQYLERFPRGSHADLARSLLQSAAE